MSEQKSFKENCEYVVETSLTNRTYTFKWRIINFPDWPDTFKVTSGEFQLAKDIVLYAVFERSLESGKDCKLLLFSARNTSFEIEHKLLILGSTGKVFSDFKPSKFVCNDQNKSSGYTIFSENFKRICTSTEDKIIIFKFTMEFVKLETENVNKYRRQTSSDLFPTVIKDFYSMYVDSVCTDFSLKSENSVLSVHKFVLCARSPVFAKMLKSPLEENEKDSIEIPDVDLSTLKAFVEFLYTGKEPEGLDLDSWCKLYYAADKYDVSSLRELCAGALLDKLDSENASQVLSLANRHSDAPFVDAVLDFMQRNFDVLMKSDGWFELVVSDPDLANRVMRLRVQKSKKGTTVDAVELK